MTRYHKIETCNMNNGPGMRTVIWLSGCPHHCKGCFNPTTWYRMSGKVFDPSAYNEVYDGLKENYCDGLTLLGGEPLAEYNLDVSMELARTAKELGKTVWCYTGYKYEFIKDLMIMQYIDVLIDGPFNIKKFNADLKWRGSANQRIINVQESLNKKTIALHPDNNEVDEYFPEQAEDPCKGMTKEEIKEKYIDNVCEEG